MKSKKLISSHVTNETTKRQCGRETENQQAVKDVSSGALKNSWVLQKEAPGEKTGEEKVTTEDDDELTEVKLEGPTLHHNKSYRSGNGFLTVPF